MASFGQTPRHVWQVAQSRSRLVKSARIASNGQLFAQVQQSAQEESIFWPVSRSALASDRSAPVGQTNLHQKRALRSPSEKTATRMPTATCDVHGIGRSISQCLRAPSSSAPTVSLRPRFRSGIGAKYPASITPAADDASTATST